MSSEHPQPGAEYKPDSLMYPINTVAEALLEAKPSQEDFVRLVRVLGGELPGQDIADNIEQLKEIEFSPTNPVDERIEIYIAKALDLLRTKYHEDVDNTAQELNTFIAARPGVFVVGETGGTLVSLHFQQVGTETIAVELKTTVGPVVVDAETRVRVDIGRLPPEERAFMRVYERQHEL